jgi:quercetin dioxygenase-like cupin family protein
VKDISKAHFSRRKFLLFSLATSMSFNASNLAYANNSKKENTMFLVKHSEHKPVDGPAEYFTGKVTIDSMFQPEGDRSYSGAIVNFEASARTTWHTHPKGQTLMILSGEGRAQIEGQEIFKLEPGDVVWFPANVRHWHGAAPNHAITEESNGKVVDWMEHVTNQDYLGKGV